MTPRAAHVAAPKSLLLIARSAGVVSYALACVSSALAAAPGEASFDLPADVAEKSLRLFSRQSGAEVVFASEIAKDVRTRAVKGELPIRRALDAMLKGTGLVVYEDRTGAFSIRPEAAAPGPGASQPPKADIDDSVKKNGIQTAPHELMKRSSFLTKLAAIVTLIVGAPANAQTAQEGVAAAGSIQGRILNSNTGNYLDNARVTIAGTNLAVLSNPFGEYQLTNVPPGEVAVTVFYSGLPPATVTLTVRPGQRAVQNFDLNAGAGGDQTVHLETFTVSTKRDMSQAAIATNEQRFAPNLKSVLAADTFGDPSEGNVAEFLKFMPSINVSYVDQDARSVSMRGLPTDTTVVTANGNQMASATSTATRSFEFELTSINNIERIEFNKTLLPDMAAEGIGGTINMITKTAFQRSRPEFRYRASINFNTTALTLGKRHGPRDEPNYLVRPGLDFSYIKPVTRTFGISVNGAFSSKYNPQYYATPTWTLNPDPETGVERPFLRSFGNTHSPKITNRYSGRIGADWRFAPRDVLRVGFTESYYDAYWMGRNMVYNVGATPTSFSPAFVQGRPGAGSATNTGGGWFKDGTTWTPEFNYTHDGPVWKFELRGAYSHASYHMRSIDHGKFSNMNITLGSLNAAGAVVAPTLRFDYNGDYTPAITATAASGESLDAGNLDNYFLNNAIANQSDATDVKKTLALYGRRVVDLAVPVTIKAGGDFRQSIRDARVFEGTYTFVGPDGRSGTADNSVARYDLRATNGIKLPMGIANYESADAFKVWDLYQSNPEWWQRNAVAELATLVDNSRYVDERVTSAYVRMDTSLLRNRLLLIGGVRFQDYRVHAESGLVNNLGRYLHDEDGDLVLDPATGRPLLLTGSTQEVAEKTNIERAIVTTNSAQGYYPSINATLRMTDNLQLRLSFAKSINYPNLNFVASRTTVSDIAGGQPRVTANSPLGPWTADNYDVDLSYFTETGGSFGVTFFRKDVRNFINSIRYSAGTPEAAAALEKYGFGQLAPLNFEIVESYNGGEARMDGWEFEMRQTLDAYVPRWAHGFTVFFNTAYKAAPTGISASNLTAVSQRLFNWGVAMKRGRLGANLRWNHVPEAKRVVPNTSYQNSKTRLDLDVSFDLTRRISLFANATNVTSVATETYLYTAQTPEYARRSNYRYYGVQCVAGIKGEF